MLRAEMFEVYLGVVSSSKSAAEVGMVPCIGWFCWGEEVIEEIKAPAVAGALGGIRISRSLWD